MILAELPDGVEEFSGTYLLKINRGHGNASKKSDGFDVTFVGREGSGGSTGPRVQLVQLVHQEPMVQTGLPVLKGRQGSPVQLGLLVLQDFKV